MEIRCLIKLINRDCSIMLQSFFLNNGSLFPHFADNILILSCIHQGVDHVLQFHAAVQLLHPADHPHAHAGVPQEAGGVAGSPQRNHSPEHLPDRPGDALPDRVFLQKVPGGRECRIYPGCQGARGVLFRPTQNVNMEVRAKKALGQHFLTDQGVVKTTN